MEISSEYKDGIAEVKAKVHSSQIKAAIAVNTALWTSLIKISEIGME